MPHGDKLEVRVKGPNVTPGYWRQDELTRKAFDEEGFYSFGDCVRFIDPADVERGLRVRRTPGRGLQAVHRHVGQRRPAAGARDRALRAARARRRDYRRDRDEIGMLGVPDVDACRALCQDLPPAADVAAVLGPSGRHGVDGGAARVVCRAGAGSSRQIMRAMLLEEPPSLDALEVTDKGSLNQRAMLARQGRARRRAVRGLAARHRHRQRRRKKGDVS